MNNYQVDKNGFYGEFGGAYVPEILYKCVHDLQEAYLPIIESEDFKAEYHALLKDYVGRPSPLYYAKRMSERYGCQLYLKREDLNHTGAHKINNTIGQILLAKRMGKTRIIAETGAGQHGVATATVCALMDMKCEVFMVYGGGALADTNINNVTNYGESNATLGSTATYTTKVKLTGGQLRDAYGGGLGDIGEPAYVYGDVQVDLNGTTTTATVGGETVYQTTPLAGTAKGCILQRLFGCNNVNGTPKGKVLVHVHATQNAAATQIANSAAVDPGMAAVTDAKVDGRYDVSAVYGGGNNAAYEPVNAFSTNEATKAGAHTHVIIDGCSLTSIQQVYGGGNAASTPATLVDINGTYEIGETFGGGNGKDDIIVNGVASANPGANVGFKDYSSVESTYDTKEKRQSPDFVSTYTYGSGAAQMNIHGGRIHSIYGGSNTKGNVRISAVTILEDVSGCPFEADEAYGGGKSAPMDATSRLEMSCIPGLKVAYGGAEDANIEGDVELNITNGTFDRVFGGNNVKGVIKGTITVNIEETGCRPVIIGQLYGGGNQAPYTAPFKAGSTTERENGPTVNVRSFTSIGEIYGGGYGESAVVTGDTYVNINVCDGRWIGTQNNGNWESSYDITGLTGMEKTFSFVEYLREYNAATQEWGFVYENGERKTQTQTVTIYQPPFTPGTIGAINRVYGGGNAAKVVGSSHVNIGTKIGDEIDFVTLPRSNIDGTPTLDEHGNQVYEKKTVKGANIIDNVYGGGNKADVTGSTHVEVGKQTATGGG